ncbi:hypothetical protein [Chroococcidiopsis thermalis]|uniref:Uncharacterized protein n=1 Tax=Chroococcidiopsis thermalis (strain PCC 7203) TaxID=251229 RepID=K9U7S7_CHRTP|nr:hypothetical protein [Chroococcidiopsis thermalis]AFY90491.1 hypothetical protein Chro_5118 [Chroococcidiopsis thermalis PCC 7203]PSB41378.1 hypothetical protein C7B80_30920 [Cyanosarcina cf. burmensis CCALA 770]
MTHLAIDSELLTDIAEDSEASLCGGVSTGISISAFADGTNFAYSRTGAFSFAVKLPDRRRVSISLGGGLSIGIDNPSD